MDRLTEKLKMLQNITPDDHFAFATKFSILASAKPSVNSIFIPGLWASSVVMTAAILIIVFINTFESPSIIKSVSEITAIESAATSFENDINITLTEIRAYGKSATKTAAALHEISSNGKVDINPSIMHKEFNALNAHPSNQEEINKLLEQAIF